MIFARKSNKIPKFYMIFARKNARILLNNWPKNIFFHFFWEGEVRALPPPVSYEYEIVPFTVRTVDIVVVVCAVSVPETNVLFSHTSAVARTLVFI